MDISQNVAWVENAEEKATDKVTKPVVGVLLVHGLNGNQSDMRELHKLFLDQGVMSENMLLPGHGSHVGDMLKLGWPEWAAAVQQETRQLKQRCDVVFLIGHSLGAALCLYTASQEEVAGVVSMCAPLHMYPWMSSPLIQMVQRVTPVLPTLREDIRDPVARHMYGREVYRWTPMAPVDSMLRHLPLLQKALPTLKIPVLVIAAQHDHVVPVSDGHEIYKLLSSREKYLMIVHRSYHVVMKDHDREAIFARTLSFVKHYASQAAQDQAS